MLLMFGPLTALYFTGILMCKYMPGAAPPTRVGPPVRPEQGAGS
jgi:hypothetical protein